jgi:hypothetical protein
MELSLLPGVICVLKNICLYIYVHIETSPHYNLPSRGQSMRLVGHHRVPTRLYAISVGHCARRRTRQHALAKRTPWARRPRSAHRRRNGQLQWPCGQLELCLLRPTGEPPVFGYSEPDG